MIITISREYGAGGHSIGQRVAKELGIEFYDKDIIRGVVRESGLDTEAIEKAEEEISRTDAFLRWITPSSYVDQHESIHTFEKRVILSLAQKGPCVILGRCADVILEEAGVDCLNVFIYGDQLHRAARVGELIGSKNPTEIQKCMKRTDLARRNYYQQTTGKRWGDCANYNLALDSGFLGYDCCVELICQAARRAKEIHL